MSKYLKEYLKLSREDLEALHTKTEATVIDRDLESAESMAFYDGIEIDSDDWELLNELTHMKIALSKMRSRDESFKPGALPLDDYLKYSYTTSKSIDASDLTVNMFAKCPIEIVPGVRNSATMYVEAVVVTKNKGAGQVFVEWKKTNSDNAPFAVVYDWNTSVNVVTGKLIS